MTVPAVCFGDVDLRVFNASNVHLVAEYRSSGLYNLNKLVNWDYQQLSVSNSPADTHKLLESTIRLYVGGHRNELFVEVVDVTTTINAWWTGEAFDNVTQTGVRLALPGSLGTAALDLSHRRAGQNVAEGLSRMNSATHTPPWSLTQSGAGYTIATTNGAEYGFSSLQYLPTGHRTRGGGVFRLDFASDVDLYNVDYSDLDVFALYGRQGTNQAIQAQPRFFLATPEPAGIVLLGLAILGAAPAARRCRLSITPR
jgi:hypothetical protein